MESDGPLIAERYELGEQIGVGGSARVYRAIDHRLARIVALKILDEGLAESVDPAAKRRFEQEARTAATFSHPNAVTVFDAGNDGERLYMAMELVTGGTLATRLADRGRLPDAEVAELGRQVAAALDAGHRVGIIHRDVKPSNILLDDEGNAKLADFGIARRFDEIEEALTSTGMVMGTRQYVSPEQAAGRELGPRTDVYSLGTVLFEAVTGSRVTPASERRDGSGFDPRTVDPSIDASLAVAISAATTFEVESRTTDASRLAAQLGGVGRPVDPRTALLPTPGPTSTTVMPKDLHPTAAGAPSPPTTTVASGGPTPGPPRLAGDLADERRRRRVAIGVVATLLMLVALAVVVGLALTDDGTTGSTDRIGDVTTSPTAVEGAVDPIDGDTSADTTVDAVSSVDTTSAVEPTSLPTSTSDPSTTTGSTSPPTPAPVDELISGFPVPSDVGDFIVLLADSEDIAGDKADDLAEKLDKLVEERLDREPDDSGGDGDESGDDGDGDGDDDDDDDDDDESRSKFQRDADKLLDDIEKWVDDGELDPTIADLARSYVDQLS